MASLREIAMRTSAAQQTDGTRVGTSLERAEQARPLFHLVRGQDSGVEQDSTQKTANNKPCSTVPFPRARNGGTSELPPEIEVGLAWLGRSRCPRDLNPTRWPSTVADAVRLGSDGWAAKAIALGWSDLDLFGVVVARDGDPDADGLAVKLGGRRLLALCGTFATVDPGAGGRLYLHRCNNDGARLLWTPGLGR